ncbi:SDR family NAD(P)-dependent oxidoreductase [Flavisolibacter ginsenosidimutans]|uniref:Glucose 1-dehydrogenase n=1 Tax=Flavisolibacter ginsenosidimutans TaxID=661481 RepID=A0A5B8UHB1_9BACT|nr:glucose 1-dehydrogenase [Flavisolibacter ginsenosidimutans]QEC55802.1 glucose 1-dehydrogenase [Flavisolibacter ginsenosidimutans]
MKLKGKVAIVTGGARDIGREVSLRLAKEGAKVVVNYFGSESEATKVAKQIKDEGGEAIAVKGDMTKWTEVVNLIDETKKAFGKEIHILTNVVGGLFGRKTIEEQDEEWYNLVMDVNLKSIFFTTKACVGAMPAGSSIINFSSQAGRDGGGGGASLYATAKGAVMTYTRAMAKELGPKGIRVNAVAPGMIATSFHDRFTKPEIRTNVAASTPLRRQGDAKDVADLVIYLASDEASFITGTNIDINGGTYFS